MDPQQEISMLMILQATCETTLERLRAAGNPVDTELTELLTLMIERSQGELQRLRAGPT